MTSVYSPSSHLEMFTVLGYTVVRSRRTNRRLYIEYTIQVRDSHTNPSCRFTQRRFKYFKNLLNAIKVQVPGKNFDMDVFHPSLFTYYSNRFRIDWLEYRKAMLQQFLRAISKDLKILYSDALHRFLLEC